MVMLVSQISTPLWRRTLKANGTSPVGYQNAHICRPAFHQRTTPRSYHANTIPPIYDSLPVTWIITVMLSTTGLGYWTIACSEALQSWRRSQVGQTELDKTNRSG